MLRAKVDVDGSELVHIFFEKGRLATVHYTFEPGHGHDRQTKVYKVDSLMFTVNAAALGSFVFDITEDSSATFLQVRIKTENRASAEFELEGYQGFRVGPGEEQILVYSKAGGANSHPSV
jgi:hypothetical protein